uniref:Frag1/DRAM/Sfk1 family protein n=1 Tax=Candidatus Kentrum sp. FW TaxID=2126338 RepID=A0A450TYL1_9GAMM|nr:MAG: Frag1/DRAM/Sfk1 family protein [Candidatus Kentron sp. FW]
MPRVHYATGPGATVCLLLVFLIGVATCIATMVLFYLAEPAHFAKRLPYITHAAGSEAGFSLFTTGMLLTTACILRSVHLVVTLHTRAISHFSPDDFRQGRWRWWKNLLWVLGMLFGLSLCGTVLSRGSLHVHFSLAFFVTITLCFFVDLLLVKAIGRIAAGGYPPAVGGWMWLRRAITGTLFVCGILMAIFYYGKAYLPGWLVPQAHNIYAVIEYLFAFLAFGYSGAYFRDALRARGFFSRAETR